MSKNSETLHRVAATFQADRDPSQDAIIGWLNTLAKNDRGQLHRSVLKYHLTQALLQYIPNAAIRASGAPSLMLAPATSVGLVPAPRPPVSASTDGIPVLTESLAPERAVEAVATAPSEMAAPVKLGGGLLRSKLKNSMGTPKSS
jgi:hypothetical protein